MIKRRENDKEKKAKNETAERANMNGKIKPKVEKLKHRNRTPKGL